MTRQEALNYIDDYVSDDSLGETADLVTAIYDYFESQKCENCKHWENDNLGKWCSLSSEEMSEKDFCSKFEVKENK